MNNPVQTAAARFRAVCKQAGYVIPTGTFQYLALMQAAIAYEREAAALEECFSFQVYY